VRDQNKKTLQRMFGGFLREVAALVFVFPILEKIVLSHRITFWYSFCTYALALGVLIIGLWFGLMGDGDE
jgi:hypothetical protein